MQSLSPILMRRPRLRGETVGKKGQAILEYVLALAIIISIVTIVSSGFRRSLFRLWEFYSKQIIAPCPGCATDPSIRLR